MQEKTDQALADAVRSIVEMAPGVTEDIVRLYAIDGYIGLIIGMVLLFVGAWAAKKSRDAELGNRGDECTAYYAGSLTAFSLGTIQSLFGVYYLSVAHFAPKAVVFQYLLGR